MRGLKERIAELNDEEALDTVGYLARWMAEDAKEMLPLNVRENIKDEKASMALLEATFPELADRLQAFSEDEARKGQIARELLLQLEEQDIFDFQLEQALNRPVLKFAEPATMSLGMALSMLLFLEFDVEYIDKKGGKRFRISKKAPVLEILSKILGL